ncbi:MAG: hypothetical protein OSB57_01835 [Planctomycetota bacterium]|nr:hypothetical protein [Planctomycetota bacterium]
MAGRVMRARRAAAAKTCEPVVAAPVAVEPEPAVEADEPSGIATLFKKKKKKTKPKPKGDSY